MVEGSQDPGRPGVEVRRSVSNPNIKDAEESVPLPVP